MPTGRKRKFGSKRTRAMTKLNRRQKREVKLMLSKEIEHKSFSGSTGAIGITTAGSVALVSNITQGVGRNSRVGDEVNIKEINFMFNVEVGATGLIAAADTYNNVRIILFKWKMDDGAGLPTTNSILESAGGNPGTLRPYNFDDRHQYHICFDKTITVFNSPIWNGAAVSWQNGVNAHYQSPKPVRIRGKKLGSSKINFDLNAVVGTGNYYFLFISDSAFTPNPTLTLESQIIYTDA